MSAALFDEQSPFIQRDTRVHRPLLATTAKLLNVRHETMVPQAIVEGRSVLDIGCALAATGKWVLDRGAQCYVGVEPQKEYVNLATELLSSYPTASIICERGMEFFAKHDARYDVVTLIGVLHGQFDVLSFLESACELAKDYVCIETQGDDVRGPVIEPVESLWMPIASRNELSTGFGWNIAPTALHRMMRYLGFAPDMEPVFVESNVGYKFFRYAMRYKRVAERGATAGDFVNVINYSDVPLPPFTNENSNNIANGVAHVDVQPSAKTNIMENFDLDELTALARLDIDQGRVEQGLSKLKCLLANPHAPAMAISMAARLYAQMRLFERAETLFLKYLAMAPGALEEQFQLGMVQLDKGDSARALGTWEGLLKQQPIFPPALFYCAMVQHKLGKLADARRNLEVLLQAVSADNLYYGRGKELLHAIQQPAAAPQSYQG